MPVSLVVTPAVRSLNKGQQQQFHADVTGGSQKVTWSVTAGTVTPSGAYAPPSLTAFARTVTLTATSVDDGTKTATATIFLPARNGNRNTDFTAAATLTGQPFVSVFLPATRGRISPVSVTIDEFTLSVPRGVQSSVPQDVKTYLDSIGATAV